MLGQNARTAQAPPVTDDPPEGALMTVREAARELGLTPNQVLLALHRGKLRGFRPGDRNWRIFRASVEAVKAAGAGSPGAANLARSRERLEAALAALEAAVAAEQRSAAQGREGGAE
jgi:excisionase family DNA binding protein